MSTLVILQFTKIISYNIFWKLEKKKWIKNFILTAEFAAGINLLMHVINAEKNPLFASTLIDR